VSQSRGPHFAVDHVEEQALDSVVRAAVAFADLPVVEFADRRHFRGAGKEASSAI